MDPSKRIVTIVLAAGVAVLLVAILLGEQMGSRVLVAAANSDSGGQVIVTPLPTDSTGGNALYGPDWKRSQTLAAAPDPGFPDPRVPPKPLPTPPPTPKPSNGPTHNPNLPIWDYTFAPSPTPQPTDSPSPLEQASTGPLPKPTALREPQD